MIIAKNIDKTYKTKVKKGLFKKERKTVEAVKGLNLRLEKGQIIGLLGINGAGKTTTIKMLSTLLEPSSGTITIDGQDVVEKRMQIKSRVNMIAGGERMIYWRLTARENLWYFGQLYGVENSLLKERIDRLLDIVGLKDKQDIPVERFSKGMKQRLQIARGLINDPDYVFLDEPTLGLDAPIAKEIRTYVKKLAEEHGKGILLTSHYIHEVEELCDYIYILHEGRVILEGTSESLSANTFEIKKTVLELKQVDDDVLEKIKTFSKAHEQILEDQIVDEKCIHFHSKEDITDDLVKLIHQNQLQIMKFYIDEPKLEDTILEISRRVSV